MDARPKLSLVIGFGSAFLIMLGVVEVLTTMFGVPELHALGAAYTALALALIWFGLWLKNYHGGFAIFTGAIILIGILLFAAMYASRPELFQAIE